MVFVFWVGETNTEINPKTGLVSTPLPPSITSVNRKVKMMEMNEIIRTLRSFVEMNKDRYSIIRIGIFGSAARDNMNEQSDIDVVVELGKPDMFCLIGIKQDLEEKFHRPVDIVRYRDRMNAFLKKKDRQGSHLCMTRSLS